MKIYNLLKILPLAAGMLLGGCMDEIDSPAVPTGTGGPLTLRAECAEMLPQYVDPSSLSRASDPKREEEKAVNILHVFFFDPDTRKLIPPTNGTSNFRPYQRIYTNVLAVPQLAFTTDLSQTQNAIVYAVANVPGKFNATWDGGEETGGTIVDGAAFMALDGVKKEDDGTALPLTEEEIAEKKAGLTPCTISNIDDLEGWVYMPVLREDVSKLPADGMPMTGKSEVINVAQNSGNVIIPMKAMMARVDVTVDLQPNQQSRDGSLPQMTIREYGVKDMPVMVPFTRTYPAGSRFGDGEITKYPVISRTVKVESRNTINADSPLEKFSYYTYENIQNRDKDATFRLKTDDGYIDQSAYENKDDYNSSIVYPKGITTDSEKQRWKPEIARKNRASALVLYADYVTHQGLKYNAQFTVYMGKDAVEDFRVMRNCQYNNNIVISGLDYVRNSTSDVYTFDGRVNVTTENPVYLAMVNERKIDAHASVRPMDVWFLLRENLPPGETADWKSEAKFELLDGCDWIRMETVPAAEMRANQFKAGTGCRPYFTTDLVTATLKENGETTTDGGYVHKHGSTVIIDGDNDGSRSRIYFYIDENVVPVNTDGDIPDRTATVRMTYTRWNLDKTKVLDQRVRTFEFEQRGLLKVTGNRNGDIDTYMEYYEEYLEHYDPLDLHEAPGELYEGLPWGLDGVYTKYVFLLNPSGYLNSDDIYHLNNGNSFGMTQWVINRNGAVPMETVKLINDTNPATAFHYVYGKNKRNATGSVPDITKGWYMPGISELEVALVQYYPVFNEFRNNFYWSAAAGKNGSTENTSRARATRVSVNNDGTITYTESGNNSASGSQARTSAHRIRAFYKAK